MSLEIWSSILTFVGSGILAWDAFQAPRRDKAKSGAKLFDTGMSCCFTCLDVWYVSSDFLKI
jgi:hypothetical protein